MNTNANATHGEVDMWTCSNNLLTRIKSYFKLKIKFANLHVSKTSFI